MLSYLRVLSLKCSPCTKCSSSQKYPCCFTGTKCILLLCIFANIRYSSDEKLSDAFVSLHKPLQTHTMTLRTVLTYVTADKDSTYYMLVYDFKIESLGITTDKFSIGIYRGIFFSFSRYQIMFVMCALTYQV